jgi:hypothetical protein
VAVERGAGSVEGDDVGEMEGSLAGRRKSLVCA